MDAGNTVQMKFPCGIYVFCVVFYCLNGFTAGENDDHDLYQVNPLKLGVEVFGIDLRQDVPDKVIAQIKQDVTKHRLMVFRDQGIISGDRHVEITQWFGEVLATFKPVPQAPHPAILRVSNDENEGLTGIGRSGWHMDGSHQSAPFSHALYHIWNASKEGDTQFVGLTDIIESLSEETFKRWDRLWMVNSETHPLIYSHPVTWKKVLCFHLGYIDTFIWDYGTDQERRTDLPETKTIIKEISDEIGKHNGFFVYSHTWTAGDFIIADNLALGHQARAETQQSRDLVGLRVMHRTTVKGVHIPEKRGLHDRQMNKQQSLSDEL